jgi:hypothetical protein
MERGRPWSLLAASRGTAAHLKQRTAKAACISRYALTVPLETHASCGVTVIRAPGARIQTRLSTGVAHLFRRRLVCSTFVKFILALAPASTYG